MSQLAIKGHPTRGKEVIELLEMLGGKNSKYCIGNNPNSFYFIDDDNAIDFYYLKIPANYTIFTLEEFLEKFPYKVGDKVETIYGKIGIVDKLIWCDGDNAVRYELEDDADSLYFENELQLYKEETMKEKLEQIILEIPAGYEFFGINDDNKVVLTKKQPQYPKTYEECCEIIGIDVSRTIEHDDCPFYKDVTCYEYALLSSLVHLRKLRICRDAYWKIAGKEMGLDKPWEPDLENEDLYCMYNYCGQIIKSSTTLAFNKILIFPTEEMRDAFYENFKDLIEKCKELL